MPFQWIVALAPGRVKPSVGSRRHPSRRRRVRPPDPADNGVDGRHQLGRVTLLVVAVAQRRLGPSSSATTSTTERVAPSSRTVRLPRSICEELAADLAGRPRDPDSLVFTAPLGGPPGERAGG
jgi:hypothetical protein